MIVALSHRECRATGSKSWALIYTFKGHRRELGLGRYPDVSLAKAREKADEARSLRADGVDPKERWRATPAQVKTFGEVATELIDDREHGWKNPKHRQQWRNTLSTYCKSIWDLPVAEVSVDHVLTVLRPIWVSKPETARRVRGRIENVLSAAKARRLRSGENPAVWKGNLDHLLAHHRKGAKRHHPAMPFEDLPAFLLDLVKIEGHGARALEFLVHTACRTSEVLNARWDEFDLDSKKWIIPAERMKAGKEHRVPLTAEALAILAAQPRTGAFVFPSGNPKRPLSNMAMTMVLRRMKLGHYTVHGFRSSFRDWCGECTSVPREIAEQALAHQVGSDVERAYRRGDALERRRELMAKWSRFLGC